MGALKAATFVQVVILALWALLLFTAGDNGLQGIDWFWFPLALAGLIYGLIRLVFLLRMLVMAREQS